jgi:hypothetical protein
LNEAVQPFEVKILVRREEIELEQLRSLTKYKDDILLLQHVGQ